MQRRARDDARVDLVERRLEGRHHRSRSATRSSRLTRVRRRPLTARFHVERALSRPSSRPPTAGRRGASRASPKRRGTRPRRGPRGRILRLFVRSTRRAGARVPRRRLLRRRILRRRLLRRRPARPVGGRLRAAGAARRAPPGRHAAHPARDTVAVTHRSHRRAVRVLLGRTGDGGAAAGVEPRRAGGDGEPHGAARGAHRHVLPVGAGGARRAKELRGARGTEHRAVARQGPRGGDARRRSGPGVLRRALRTDVGRGRVSRRIFLWEFWQLRRRSRSRRPAKPERAGDLDAVVARGRLQRRQGGAQGPAAEAAREDTRGGRGGDGGRIGRELFRAF